jgi:hypothetical protein
MKAFQAREPLNNSVVQEKMAVMTRTTRTPHSPWTRSILGLMVVAYVMGLLGVAHHLATHVHHDHALAPDGSGHQALAEDHGHGALPVQAAFRAQAEDTCCQHVHDTPPSVLPLPARDLTTKGVSRLLALPCRILVVQDSSGPELPRPVDVTLQVCPGAVTVASGRAPPRFLHC